YSGFPTAILFPGIHVLIISVRLLLTPCPNGHTICSSCKHRVDNHCPTCRQKLGNVRCLALEKVAESIQLPCKYQSLGCTWIHPYQNKLKYKELCRFMLCSCPYAGHIGVKRMKKLHLDGLLESLDFDSLDTCEPCL
ncbi:hypothetical protein ZWY2020_001014, partial [Hordeum vulgare]